MAAKQLISLAVLSVLLGFTVALPRAQSGRGRPARPQLLNRNTNVASYPQSSSLPPVVNSFLGSGVPHGAQLINMKPMLLPISQRLPDNYTLIRPNVVDNFRCEGDNFPNGYRNYGYYADQDNECQVFHVCLPMQQLYPNNFTDPITYQFSFICPEYTIFTQDAMVCQWSNEAVPCEYAADLYNLNDNFFSDKGMDGETYGRRISFNERTGINRPESLIVN